MTSPALAFGVTWDYRCPFARNAHEHVVTALEDGADWAVTFVPFSLGQVHVEDGELPIWDRPGDDTGLLALQVGVTVRDHHPDAFLAVHRDLFALRHDRGGRIDDRDTLAKVLTDHGLDSSEVLDVVDRGAALSHVRTEHERAAKVHHVWGVPTFIQGDRAVFVRIMDRPGSDALHARRTVERVVTLLDEAPNLNEWKHTSIPR